ncbi:MAG: aspartate--tRNA ligase [Acidobacteria bacterium]|nr:aspartate--tRNA ligase [Acidobacteriota bacterium]MBI3655726.1 aspartate--tRNA ligase [Acidobacteriota bacterium]
MESKVEPKLENMGNLVRSHTCGELRPSSVGQRALLMGWVDRRRDMGQIIFIDLRDREGITQIVVRSDADAEAHRTAEALRPEYVLAVEGTVVARDPQTINPNLPTGEVELLADRIYWLNDSQTPPFELTDDVRAPEELRLAYRYLDLRRPKMQRNIRLRHAVSWAIREYMNQQGFLEIETPFLTKSTPEGARDYLVPSRVQPGRFYALPQSPQLFKQILMISGFDRYFQIVRCFRDEDLRADRQPEFTQVDIEMSFPQREVLFGLIEGLMVKAFACANVTVTTPFPRMTYQEAIERYGSDKPDTRFGLELINLSDLFRESEFRVFKDIVQKGGYVKAITVPSGGRYSRKELDDLVEVAKQFGAQGLLWVRPDGDGVKSSFPKAVTEETLRAVLRRAQANPDSLVLIAAGALKNVSEILSGLRLHLGRRENLIDNGRYNFLWVTEFPLFVYDEKERRFMAMHHPFTAPLDEDIDRLTTAPEAVRAKAYDLVLNGMEIGGGSLRIHRQDHQRTIFQALGIRKEEAEEKFGFFLNALQYGTPPHGGIALGLDRIVMILAGEKSLREVIAFPKTASATCPLTQAPSSVSPAQLSELRIQSTDTE